MPQFALQNVRLYAQQTYRDKLRSDILMSERVLYEVEEIIGRKVFSGKVLYLVKWKDFPREQATWESVKLLKNVKHLVKHYHDKHKEEVRNELEQQNDPTTTTTKKKRGKTANQKQEPDMDMFYEEEGEEQKNGHSDLKGPEQKPVKAVNLSASNTDPLASVQKLSAQPSRPQQTVLMKSKPLEPSEPNETLKANGLSPKDGGIMLKKIYFLQKTGENELQYLVEEANGTFRKCLGNDLVHKYPRELVKYLEEALLCRLGK